MTASLRRRPSVASPPTGARGQKPKSSERSARPGKQIARWARTLFENDEFLEPRTVGGRGAEQRVDHRVELAAVRRKVLVEIKHRFRCRLSAADRLFDGF